MLNNLTNSIKTIRVSNDGAGAASATPTKCTIVDMENFRSVRFVAMFGNVLDTSAVALKAATATTNDTAQMSLVTGAEVTGTAGASNYDDKMVILDIPEVNKQFIECQIFHVTANAPFDGVIAELYNSKDYPVTQDSTVILYDTVTA